MVFTFDAFMLPNAIPFIECARKTPYCSRKQAVNAGKRQTKLSGTPLRPYQCPHCNSWHIAKDQKAIKGRKR